MRYLIAILSLTLAVTVYAGQQHHHGKHHPKHLFEKADTDNDGNISIDEHEAALDRMIQHRREQFRKMDTNDDGLLSKKEAKAGREAMREQWREKHAQHHDKS